MTTPRVVRAAGSLVEVRPLGDVSLYELVRVGERGLLGEVVRISDDVATVQVYEETGGLRVGEPVVPSGHTLTLPLGPGLLGSVLDGVGRPLPQLAARGAFITPGLTAPTLDASRRWEFRADRRPGTPLEPGDVLGVVEERPGFAHRILVPPRVSGTLAALETGSYTVDQEIGRLENGVVLRLAHQWPVRLPRPSARRLPAERPLLTGQRVFDLLFPVAEGGTVAVPGGFGTGKTVIEQSLAKYGDADVVVYVGCGERGNEMAEVLHEFPRLTDPRTGRSLSDRTVLVINTSNMPVAAREASVFVGMTIGEYYRDMGYRVAVMADSLSRWAEALREMGARLQEMPGEEGYPATLGNRLGKFYERAGRVVAVGRPERTGALTIISAVSPPGGDLSEPVTQASLRVAGALWALDSSLAHQRQFPAVDWDVSYSLYADSLAPWFSQAADVDWAGLRRETLSLLQEERELREVAGLVGPEALQDADRLVLEVARAMRDSVLGQSAFDPNDATSSIEKTRHLAELALELRRKGAAAIAGGVAFDQLALEPAIRALATLRRAGPSQLEARIADARSAVNAVALIGAAP
jgi:V/A-type H+/Na+-transporting ATPase subunit A